MSDDIGSAPSLDARYKLAITIAYFALIVIAFLVVGLIVVFRPDATATIIQFAGTTLAVASTGAVTFYMLGKIATQTNGTNAALRAENAELNRQLLQVVAAAPAAPTGDHVKPD